ncbi:hypothetical protein PP713_02075 [Mycobacterium sp. CSUR Q5927]|nr:hypothetical protein [Mycobacterium sp. CSUR Q5927]
MDPPVTGAIGRRPADAAAFVEFVQDMTNDYRPEVIYELYAADARLVMISDGAREESVGVQAIHTAWARSCAVFEARRFRLSKRLVATTEDTIVNEWWGARMAGATVAVSKSGGSTRTRRCATCMSTAS